jgi:hypothetical protein
MLEEILILMLVDMRIKTIVKWWLAEKTQFMGVLDGNSKKAL